MADIYSLVRRVRSRVHDIAGLDQPVEGRPLYLDHIYEDAIYSGLARVNLDINNAYSVDTLPSKYDYLLELRGAINLCYIRGGEGASGDVEDFPNVPDSIVSVPQLTVQRQQMPLEGPKYWLKMAEMLETEYKTTLSRLDDRGDEGATIQQYTMNRLSLRTGRRTGYVFDRAISAPPLSAFLVGGRVSLTWSEVYDEYFRIYDVERSATADFSTTQTVFSSSDNHDIKYIDRAPSGTWFYRLKVTNSNNLESVSSAVVVVVP
jgi:hypothetical protein